jgi:hypothetical protein
MSLAQIADSSIWLPGADVDESPFLAMTRPSQVALKNRLLAISELRDRRTNFSFLLFGY